MSNKATDVLMQLTADSGPLQAECLTEVDTDNDNFAAGFSPGTFFELQNFSFGFNIDEKDPTKDTVNPGAPKLNSGYGGQQQSVSAMSAQHAASKSSAGAFARWKAASADDLKKMKRYPVRMDELKIDRIYDRASPLLFRACCDSSSFASATMIKRKDVGGSKLQSFLRLEFTDLLISHIDWKNGDEISESVKFVFRKVVVRYKKTSFQAGSQQPILVELASVNWSYDTELVNRTQSL
jgi:type VI protein secretion system component Hcp